MQISRDKYSFFRPAPAGSTSSRFENLGFHCLLPAHPPLQASYPVSVRQVVAVAPASFRPRLTATPLPSLNGSDSLDHRGLTPPRTITCTAYRIEAGHDRLRGVTLRHTGPPRCGSRHPHPSGRVPFFRGPAGPSLRCVPAGGSLMPMYCHTPRALSTPLLSDCLVVGPTPLAH